jgi:hypothetical protein
MIHSNRVVTPPPCRLQSLISPSSPPRLCHPNLTCRPPRLLYLTTVCPTSLSCPHRCSIPHTLPQPHLSSSAPPSCPTSPSSVSAMFSSPPSQHHCHFCIGLDRELETNELAKLVCSSTLLKWAQPFFNESSNFICSFC